MIEKEITVLLNSKKDNSWKSISSCMKQLHDLSKSDSRLLDGRCKICARKRQATYRLTCRGREMNQRANYSSYKRKLLTNIRHKKARILELEKELQTWQKNPKLN